MDSPEAPPEGCSRMSKPVSVPKRAKEKGEMVRIEMGCN